MTAELALPHMIGVAEPAVVVPARVCSLLERLPEMSALRVRVRGVDREAAAVLVAIREAAMLWRSGFASATTDAPKPQPAALSGEWIGTTLAAEFAQVSPTAIRKAIDRGELPGVRVGDRRRVRREDLEHYRAARAARNQEQ